MLMENPYMISAIVAIIGVIINVLVNKYREKENNMSELLKVFILLLLISCVIFYVKGDIKIPMQKGGSRLENAIQIGDPGF